MIPSIFSTPFINCTQSLLTHSSRFFATPSYSFDPQYPKVVADALSATQDIQNNMTVLVGGFGLCGIPENSIHALVKSGVSGLTVVSNNAGVDDCGLGLLLQTQQISRIIASYVGENALFEKQYLEGFLELHLTPQGTLAEKLRAGGAGIPAFYTATGYGTPVADGSIPIRNGVMPLFSPKKQTRNINGKDYILEYAIRGDFSLVRAKRGDKLGNLQFEGTAQNFNPDCAKAAQITIAEVEELVEPGEIPPHEIHLPGIYVDRVFLGKNYENRIERVTTRSSKAEDGGIIKFSPDNLPQKSREIICARAAQEIQDNTVINLGIGLPTLIPNYTTSNAILQSENGLLGIGPYPVQGSEDSQLINAGKETITMVPGSSLFSSSESFAMIRGGHLDLTILGAMEVNRDGDLANWMIPGIKIKGMGGAMDLVSSGSRVVVTMTHTTKDGSPKILDLCALPLTGKAVVDRIITDKAVIDIGKPGRRPILVEKYPGTTSQQIQQLTGTKLEIPPHVPDMKFW